MPLSSQHPVSPLPRQQNQEQPSGKPKPRTPSFSRASLRHRPFHKKRARHQPLLPLSLLNQHQEAMNYFWGESTPAPAHPEAAGKVYKSVDDVDFQAFGEENVQILLNRHSGQDGVTSWELIDSQAEGHVQIWRGEVQNNSWSPFQASRRISADKVTIQKALTDPKLLLQLDDMTESVRILKSLDDEGKLSLRYIVSKGIFPVAARDFLLVTYATSLPDGRLIIASRSIAVDGVSATTDGAVRGVNVVSGYLIKELPDANGKPCCEVTLLAHADLQGYIPATVVNMLGTSATVKILANLQTIVEKL